MSPISPKKLRTLMRPSPDTTPIINIIGSLGHKYLREYMLTCFLLCENRTSSKDALKKRLGRQSYCMNLTERNWVWEKPDAGWWAFVSTRGISFEVKADFDEVQAWNAWRDFRKDLKISDADLENMDELMHQRAKKEDEAHQ